MELSVIIKALRVELGLSQEEFANKISLSRSNYSHFEIGRSNLSVEQLNEIAKIFHINMSILYEMLNLDEELLPKLLPKLLNKSIESANNHELYTPKTKFPDSSVNDLIKAMESMTEIMKANAEIEKIKAESNAESIRLNAENERLKLENERLNAIANERNSRSMENLISSLLAEGKGTGQKEKIKKDTFLEFTTVNVE